MTGELCVRCKGAKLLCGLPRCPLLERTSAKLPPIRVRGRELSGPSPPAVFVGRYGYPDVRIGPMLPAVEGMDVTGLASTSELFGSPVGEIIDKRSALVRTASKCHVRSPAYRLTRPGHSTGALPVGEWDVPDILHPQARFEAMDPSRMNATGQRRFREVLDVSQELSLSIRSVDTEVRLTRPVEQIAPVTVTDPFAAPHGPTVEVERASLSSNPHVPRKVDHIVSDDQCPAATGMLEMERAGIDHTQIQRLLSVGLLGRNSSRRLVPTRWSITATDDTLSMAFVDRIRDHASVDKFELYRASYIGNHFYIILIPREWCFEMNECWCPGAFWSGKTPTVLRDHEGYRGRSTYASAITGAYYAARLSVARHLLGRSRQAGVLLYREITEDYRAPLGVWVIRETVRAAMASTPLIFDDLGSAIGKVEERVRNRGWWKGSALYADTKRQRRITEF